MKEYETSDFGGKGRKTDQKLKPFLVLQYLMKYSDDEHVVSASDLVGYLQEIGISAERRSIYKDIEEINKALYIVENDVDIIDAEEAIIDDEEKTVVYDSSKKGFFVRQRHYDHDDIKLVAECVYSARFIDEKRAKRLVDAVCGMTSEYKAEKIKHDAFLVDRVKTGNTKVYYNVSTINDAMSEKICGEKHVPEKIRFKYLEYTIDDIKNQVERRKGTDYVVSPYKLLINDGNYYLLAYDGQSGIMKTYRVDRMKNVSLTGEKREGEKAYADIDIKAYARSHFSMFDGKKEYVTISFRENLLDTFIDRFGTQNVIYSRQDENNLKITVEVEVSDTFFAWVCGFTDRIKIITPDSVKQNFAEYLDKIRSMY